MRTSGNYLIDAKDGANGLGCPIRDLCMFFRDKMADMPESATLMKNRYCNGEHTNCARWMVRSELGPAKVPGDMFPHQRERATQLLVHRTG